MRESRTDRALRAFADWFASKGGVYQTTIVVMLIVGVEAMRPHLDDHGFWLLYWMTVYSAVTQPVLAYCARTASEKADQDVGAVMHSLDDLKAEEDEILRRLED